MNGMNNFNENGQDIAAHGASGLMGFIVGAAVGASIALLLAPAPGNETRRRLGQTAKRWGASARDGMQHAKERIGELRHNVNDRIGDLKEDVNTAVGAGREAYSRERENRFQPQNPTPGV